jgi:hypothetical protein
MSLSEIFFYNASMTNPVRFFPAIIVQGHHRGLRDEKIKSLLDGWGVSRFDVISLTADKSIGIAAVRSALSALFLSPVNSPYSVLVFPDGTLLTPDAKQALLKVLEEPPPRSAIILAVDRTDQLLPTIISRCIVINAGDDKGPCDLNLQQVISLVSASPGKTVSMLEPYCQSRETARDFINCLSNVLCSKQSGPLSLDKLGFQTSGRLLINITRAVKMLEANLPINACLESIFLDK